MITTEFRRLVEEGLKRMNISARQAALKAELSPSYLSRIMSGTRDFPSDEAILKLAEVLEIEPPEMLLAEAGRVRFRAKKDLSQEELDEVMKVIRSVMAGERRSIRRRKKKLD